MTGWQHALDLPAREAVLRPDSREMRKWTPFSWRRECQPPAVGARVPNQLEANNSHEGSSSRTGREQKPEKALLPVLSCIPPSHDSEPSAWLHTTPAITNRKSNPI